MRVSFAIVLAVAASLISATPIDANAQKCPFFCWIDINCEDCTWGLCKFPFCTTDLSLYIVELIDPLEEWNWLLDKESRDGRGASESVLVRGSTIDHIRIGMTRANSEKRAGADGCAHRVGPEYWSTLDRGANGVGVGIYENTPNWGLSGL
ncbi:hypothetical protein F4604DRAFT_1982745 [Suillus subluteus]|nr:hypothetical protein F4604DRAFT_1982745 [Suillus subluteus]